MRRLLALSFVLCLCLGSVAEAAWTHVGNTANTSGVSFTGAATRTCVVTRTFTNGNLGIVVMYLHSGSGSASALSASDSTTAAWTQGQVYNVGLDAIAIFYNPNITGAPTTVTVSGVSGTGTGTIDCWADEFSGGVPQTIQDGGTSQLQTNPGTGTDAVTSGAFSTAQSGDLIYATTVQITGTAIAPTAGTGFTRWNSQTGAASLRGEASESLVQSSAGSTAGTWTQTQATSNWITVAQGFTISAASTLAGRNLLLGVGK
jgi:hypothetical protein